MNSLFSILLKNLILLGLIVVSLVFVFSQNIGYKEVRYLFLGLGILYIITSCFEAYKLSQLKNETQKFIYFTDGFFAKRFIKVIIFLCCGVLLYISDSIIKYMSFLCFLVAITEIIVTLWRYSKKLCFVAFDGSAFIISTSKLQIMYAATIIKIESRHGITYFIDDKNNAFTVRTDMMKEKDAFNTALDSWILQNHLEQKLVKPQ